MTMKLFVAAGALAIGLAAHAADSGIRWVQASPLLVRAEPKAQAPVVGRLQQGSRVAAVREVPGTDYCEVSTHWDRSGYVACRHLSATEVAPRRAGQAGVPTSTRWVSGSVVVLRAAPEPQATALARLPLNTELTLDAPSTGGYCQVHTAAAPGQPSQSGFTACRYLDESPVALERIGPAQGPDGQPNPDMDPRKAFAIEPSWEHLGRYQQWLGRRCDDPPSCPAVAQDADLVAMRRLLHGQAVTARDLPPEWPAWGASALSPDRGLDLGNREAMDTALWRALPVPGVKPSWFRDAAELAGPAESLAQLASRFNAGQQWFVGELYSPEARFAGARVERLTQKLQRIELLSDGRARAELTTPQFVNREWLPDIDFMCQNWSGVGYAYGDTDAATRQRNAFGPAPNAGGPRRLFWFHSSRPLPAGPARSERQVLKLDRASTGFTQAELRPFDLDADGVPDLLWVEATGRGPGHLGDPPMHDDPWLRLLLVNLNGQWRLLATDAISWGCGC